MIKKKSMLIILLATGIVSLSCFLIFSYVSKPAYIAIKGSEESKVLNYLKNNVSAIDINDASGVKTLSLLDSSLESNEVFLCGESHSIEKNTEIMLCLLKYMNQKGNVKYLLTEQGYSQAQLINIYLKTGDESILKDIYSELKGTASWSKETYDFWVELYKYNSNLSNDKKIFVVGADIEHQPLTAFRYLHDILPQNKAPENINKNVEHLRDNRTSYSLVKDSFAEKLSEDIGKYEEDYKSYLKDNYFDFRFVVENLVNSDKYYSSGTNSEDLREECIRENFKKIYSHLPKGKFFGQWGLEHTYLSNHGGVNGKDNCFATYLNSGFEPTKGKVVSIAYFYSNSEYMSRGKKYGVEKVNEVKGVDLLEKVSESDYTLIRFDGERTPFKDKPYFVNNPKGGGTKDYYQFGILIKNSPPAHPYENQ